MIYNSVVSLLVAFFNITVACKIRIVTRIYVALVLELTVFMVLTISFKADTDNGVIDYQDAKNGKPSPLKRDIPKCTSILWHCFFFLLGICHFLPVSFFSAANSFFLDKFRNTTSSASEDRTSLQSSFASSTLICGSVILLIFGIFNITVAHKVRIMTRIYVTLSLEFIVFILLTITVKVDTDNVQMEYFCFVMVAYGILTATNTVNILATANLYPRFPRVYMHTCLAGEGSAGIVGDLLNVISVAIFKGDLTKGTLMYFTIGSAIVVLSTLLIVVAGRSPLFQECLASLSENVKRKRHSVRELWDLLKKIKFPTIIALYFSFTLALTHPAITSLVVSEYTDTLWADSYFSAVVTYLLSDTFQLLGRLICSYTKFISFQTDLPERWFYFLGFIRFAIMVPFIWMCNAQPRNNIPVLFPHDYQYGIILAVFTFMNGVVLNWGMLQLPKKVLKEEVDGAFTVFGFTTGIFGLLTSPLSLFIVNML